MWIKRIPKNYYENSSLWYDDVFLWQSDNVFVMDNHRLALWCWLQSCDSERKYNFMHIDRHYDMLKCFHDSDLEPIKKDRHIDFDTFSNLERTNGSSKLLRWDNYIMAGYALQPEWFHTNIFLTHEEGSIDDSCFHKPMIIREENPLYMERFMHEYIEASRKCLDGIAGEDYKLPWIVNLDLDVFYTEDSSIQLFSDEYIRKIAEILQNNIKRISVLTIAISPDCLGGESLREKWANGFRILKIMSEKMECLNKLVADVSIIDQRTP